MSDEEGKAQKIGVSAPPADVESINQAHLRAEQVAGHRISFSAFVRTALKWAINDDGFWETYRKEVEGKE
jgi:hypothetical protein